MKTSYGILKRTGLILLLVSTGALISQGGSWRWMRGYHPRKDIVTLVITGNYTKSRALADLIQISTRQPYILLPANGKQKIFFVPYKHAALEIRESNLARFIKFIHPRQIVILGDKRYVAQKYRDMIDPRQTVITVKNEDWQKSAESIGRILNISFLAEDFKELIEKKVEAGELYRPVKIKLPSSPESETTESIPEAVNVNENTGEINIGEPEETDNPVLVPEEQSTNDEKTKKTAVTGDKSNTGSLISNPAPPPVDTNTKSRIKEPKITPPPSGTSEKEKKKNAQLKKEGPTLIEDK